jgi:general secretion pathway protein C
MTSPRVGRQDFAQGTMVALATGASLFLLAMIGAYWTWQWLGPAHVMRLPAAVSTVAKADSASDLFGNSVLPADSALVSGSGIRLLGSVVANAGHTGYALLRIDPRLTMAVREGDEILPGLRLAGVARNHVILERGGVRETLAWPAKAGATEPAAARLLK